MSDEVSLSMHISIMVCCTAGLLSVVLGILVMSIDLLNDYSNKYTNAVNSSTESSIYSIAMNGDVPMSVIYSSLEQSLNIVGEVYVGEYDETNGTVNNQTCIYEYDNINNQKLLTLLTRYKVNRGIVFIEPSTTSGLITVRVGWVE